MKKAISSIIVGLLLISSIICANTTEVKAAINLSDLDYDLNGIIDKEDLALIKTNYILNRYDVKYDLNKDNKIDVFDIAIMTKEIGKEATGLQDNTDITSKFTDAKFKYVVYNIIGKTSPEPILYSDVKYIQKMDVRTVSMSNHYGDIRDTPINNLSGIEYFTSLYSFDCNYNNLTSLDVSNNTALTHLSCMNNRLTNLDVSKNTALTVLYWAL